MVDDYLMIYESMINEIDDKRVSIRDSLSA